MAGRSDQLACDRKQPGAPKTLSQLPSLTAAELDKLIRSRKSFLMIRRRGQQERGEQRGRSKPVSEISSPSNVDSDSRELGRSQCSTRLGEAAVPQGPAEARATSPCAGGHATWQRGAADSLSEQPKWSSADQLDCCRKRFCFSRTLGELPTFGLDWSAGGRQRLPGTSSGQRELGAAGLVDREWTALDAPVKFEREVSGGEACTVANSQGSDESEDCESSFASVATDLMSEDDFGEVLKDAHVQHLLPGDVETMLKVTDTNSYGGGL